MELHTKLDGALGLDPTSGSSMDFQDQRGPGGQQGLRSVCPHSPLLLGAHWWAPGLSSMCVKDTERWGSEGAGGSADLPGGQQDLLPASPPPLYSLFATCVTSSPRVWHLLSRPTVLGAAVGTEGDQFCPQPLRHRCGQVTPAYA